MILNQAFHLLECDVDVIVGNIYISAVSIYL
jgi:hypothetical protein